MKKPFKEHDLYEQHEMLKKMRKERKRKLFEKLIYEIGDIIRVRKKITYKFPFIKKLTPEEIINSYEYKRFKTKYPELCGLIEGFR